MDVLGGYLDWKLGIDVSIVQDVVDATSKRHKVH